jgi:hypothetical protein
MTDFSDKIVKKIKSHIFFSVACFENRTVYEIMWKYFVQGDRPQMTAHCCVCNGRFKTIFITAQISKYFHTVTIVTCAVPTLVMKANDVLCIAVLHLCK